MNVAKRYAVVLLLSLGLVGTALAAKTDPAKVTVYITNTGKKYHDGSCRHLKKSKIAISLKAAKAEGYEPCKVCDPPE